MVRLGKRSDPFRFIFALSWIFFFSGRETENTIVFFCAGEASISWRIYGICLTFDMSKVAISPYLFLETLDFRQIISRKYMKDMRIFHSGLLKFETSDGFAEGDSFR